MDREYGRIVETLSATHEEYRYAMDRDMPMMIFVRGHHDKDRHSETQKFFDEIRSDGHTYRRFHDRVDLLPEIIQGLTRIFDESYSIKVEHFVSRFKGKVGKASPFEQMVLQVRETGLDLDIAREWLQSVNEIQENEKPSTITLLNKLREKGLVWKESGEQVFKAMASGLLFLGKNPSDHFPQCRILADAYSGTEPDPTPRDQETISGAAPRMVNRIVDFVMTNTRHPIRVVGIHRIKLDEYPQEVIREAIVNAIAHRDYEDNARPIYVKVLFDRVEILSPGNLLPPLTINKLVKGKFEPCSRNPTLAQYLGHLRLMEQRGSGIQRMRTAMINHGLEAPEYVFRDGYFTIILKGPGDQMERLRIPSSTGDLPPAIDEQLNERHHQILSRAAQEGTVSTAWVVEELGVVKDTARRDFALLIDLGLLERKGRGRNTRYVLSQHPQESNDDRPMKREK